MFWGAVRMGDTKLEQPLTPELDKEAEVRDTSQKCGEFVDFLIHEKGMRLAEYDLIDELCEVHCSDAKMVEWLSEFFGINAEKAEKEREALLEYCRQQK